MARVTVKQLRAEAKRRLLECGNGKTMSRMNKRELLNFISCIHHPNADSLGADDLRDIGHAEGPQALAERLAKLAAGCGLDGVVCSAQEAKTLRQACGPDFRLVTPGIRLVDAAQDDQKRIMTPALAVANGADYLVIGRPITRAADPLAVIDRIAAEIGG